MLKISLLYTGKLYTPNKLSINKFTRNKICLYHAKWKWLVCWLTLEVALCTSYTVLTITFTELLTQPGILHGYSECEKQWTVNKQQWMSTINLLQVYGRWYHNFPCCNHESKLSATENYPCRSNLPVKLTYTDVTWCKAGTSPIFSVVIQSKKCVREYTGTAEKSLPSLSKVYHLQFLLKQ